ncbi:MAG: HAD family hydrolase [Ktedonobacterales bacterium]|nr:HAD family hydrolase [Ktedonobacterales bacterium]
MTRHCDLVVFDLDGTLVDTAALHVAATQAAVSAIFGEPAASALVARSLGLPLRDSLGVVSNGRGHIPELMVAFMEYYTDHEGEAARCFADAIPTLAALRAVGIPLALLSNKLRAWGQAEIARLGLTPYFRHVVFMEDMPVPKPSGRALQPILTALGMAATRTLLIGDGVGDMQCAAEAGALSGAALWGPHDPAPLLAMHPTYAFREMRDILTALSL